MSIFNRHVDGYDSLGRDSLTDFPDPTCWSKWVYGVITPVLLLAWGAHACIEKQAVWIWIIGERFSGRNRIELFDDQAVAFGLAWISFACFLHVHYYWTASPRLAVLSELGKTVSALGLIGSLGYLFWSIVSGWI